MSLEEKIKKAQQIYSDIQMTFNGYDTARLDDELGADLIYPSENQRGTGGIIILDDGQYFVCGSQKTIEQYYEDFKKVITLRKTINEVADSKIKEFRENYSESVLDDSEIRNIVINAMQLIDSIACNSETSIAELIHYNPENKNLDPMTQGFIVNIIKDLCNHYKFQIQLEFNHDMIGGLMFFQKFIKLPSIKKDEYEYLFERDDKDAFKHLIIPANEPSNEYSDKLDLIGKLPEDYTTDEIIRMKKYSEKMHKELHSEDSKIINKEVLTGKLVDKLQEDSNDELSEFQKKMAKENEEFMRYLYDKQTFMFYWYAGAVLPLNHPHYYDGRIIVDIKNRFGLTGKINHEKEEYELTQELYLKLENLVSNNIDRLIKIALNQNSIMIDGVSNHMSIKYKSVFLNISKFNCSDEEDRNYLESFENELMNILFKKESHKYELSDLDKKMMEKMDIDPTNIKNTKDLMDAIEKKKEKMLNTENLDDLDSRVQQFAKENGFQKAEYSKDWNGYKCYDPISDRPSYTGLPRIILVDSNGNIRMSTGDEGLKYIREMRDE